MSGKTADLTILLASNLTSKMWLTWLFLNSVMSLPVLKSQTLTDLS